MAVRTQIGGSFAPPLTDELLAAYHALALEAGEEIRDAMLKLHACAAQWWELPESTGDGKPHPSGRGYIVALDAPIATALWEAIPWTRELDMFGALFDTLPTGRLRNAAFHLLWFAKELDLDREPLTSDKL